MDLKRIALTLAVGILLAFFVGFLVDAIYEAPQYEDFCRDDQFERPVPLKRPLAEQAQECEEFIISNELRESCNDKKGYLASDYDDNGCVTNVYCETCDVEFDIAREKYNRNLFFILVPISILLIIIGMFLHLESIGSGFILGGILTLIYATARVFGDLSKIMRVILLGIELVIVIWVGYKKIEQSNHDKKPKKKKK